MILIGGINLKNSLVVSIVFYFVKFQYYLNFRICHLHIFIDSLPVFYLSPNLLLNKKLFPPWDKSLQATTTKPHSSASSPSFPPQSLAQSSPQSPLSLPKVFCSFIPWSFFVYQCLNATCWAPFRCFRSFRLCSIIVFGLMIIWTARGQKCAFSFFMLSCRLINFFRWLLLRGNCRFRLVFSLITWSRVRLFRFFPVFIFRFIHWNRFRFCGFSFQIGYRSRFFWLKVQWCQIWVFIFFREGARFSYDEVAWCG